MISVLDPIRSAGSTGEVWSGATWVGQIDRHDVRGADLRLGDADDFTRARLLIWESGQPRGFVEIPVVDAVVDGVDLLARIAELPEVSPRPGLRTLPPVSVAVCTRDRPDNLRKMLGNLQALSYPDVELIVVDNHPESGLTPPVVASFPELSIRLIDAAGMGLSIARNVALMHASHDIVAFTDDDVLVDAEWLTNLVRPFVEDERIACVCGMVPSAELDTASQSYFDRRVDWARSCEPATYDLAAPPEGELLFPLRVAQFGTGANFAVRRDVVVELGGFDEGLGIGSPTGGGEDIDLFVRVLLGGWRLGREPSAVVWHIHRRTAGDLGVQIHNYGLGLGAWAAKLMGRPRTALMVMRRLGPGIRHLRGIAVVDQGDTIGTDRALEGLYRRELQGVLFGPIALLQARIAGRAAQPLQSSSTRLGRAIDFRSQQMWGEPGNSIAKGRFALTAVIFGLIGMIGAVSALPTFVLVPAVAAFMLLGPGSLVLSWYSHLPTYALVPLLPILGFAICVVTVTGLLMLGIYDPVLTLWGMTFAIVIGGLLRCGYLSQRQAASTS